MIVRAAQNALENGNVVRAAHSYIEAAFIAQKAGQTDAARALVGRASRLAASPLLTAAQRTEIARRIESRNLAVRK